MGSRAWQQFLRSIKDIDYFLSRPRKKGKGVNLHDKRAAIIFMHTSTEIYVEDSIREAADKILDFCTVDNVPKQWKKLSADKIKRSKDDLSPFSLVTFDWRDVLREDLHSEITRINIVKIQNISDVVERIGVSSFQEEVAKNVSKDSINDEQAKAFISSFLEDLVRERGDIVHRRAAPRWVKSSIETRKIIIEEICRSIDNTLLNYVKRKTGQRSRDLYWNSVRQKRATLTPTLVAELESSR